MTPRRSGVATLAGTIVLLLIGSVAGIARAHEPSVALTTGSGPFRPGADDSAGDVDPGVSPVDISVNATAPPAPTTTVITGPVPPATTARTASTTKPPGPSTPSGTSGRPAGGDHRDRPRGPGEVGSVEDLGPGPVESTAPAPCTPSSQATPTHAIAVIELAQGCVRALVPAGVRVGTEVSWNPEGTWLVAAVKGRVLRVARDGSWRQDLGGGDQVTSVVLSPDGRRMVVLGQMAVPVLDQKPVVVIAAADGTEGRVLGGRFLSAPSWSPDSQVVALMSNVGGVEVPDIVHIVGSEGRELARRTFADRALWGTPPVGGGTTMFRSGPAPLGPPTFLPDGRLFLPAFIELPRPGTGVWLDRSLRDAGGPEPPSDLRYPAGVSAPNDTSGLIYTGSSPNDNTLELARHLDLRTGAVRTLAQGAALPSSAHRANAVAFIPHEATGPGLGLTIADGAGSLRVVWRNAGTNSTAVSAGRPVWTPDDAAVAAVTPG